MPYKNEDKTNILKNYDLLRAIVKNSHSGILIIDDNFRMVYGNDRLLETFGYIWEEFHGKDFRDFVSGETKKIFVERYLKLQRGQEVPPRFEIKIANKGGEIRDIEFRAVSAESVDNKTVIVCQLLDITDQKLAQKQLEESEKKYRDIFYNVNDFIYIHDLKGILRETNYHFREKSGFDKPELEDHNVKDFIDERYRMFFDDYLKRVLKNGQDQGIMKIVAKDGSHIYMEYKNTLVCDPEGTLCINGVGRDITTQVKIQKALRKSEAKLKASEQKYRDIFENVNDFIYMHDLEGHFLETNHHFVRNLEYAEGELIGRRISEFIPQAYQHKFENYLKRILTTGQDHGIMQFLKKNDDTIFFEYKNSLVKNEDGPIYIRGLGRDITEQIKAKRALRQSQKKLKAAHDELEKRVQARTEALEEANTALRVLLLKKDENQKEMEERVLQNVKDLIMPLILKMKQGSMSVNQRAYADIIETTLNDIISPFVHILSKKYSSLTPTEIQIANLIKEGKTTKEIAEIMHVVDGTIHFHRNNLRHKLSIAKKNINLRTYLLSLEDPDSRE